MSIERLANDAISFKVKLRRPFRNTESRAGVLIQGPSGWGEFAPFPEYSNDIAGRWLAAALESACGVWPTPVRTHVPVNAIIPAVTTEDAYQLTSDAVLNSGISTFKIKVGGQVTAGIHEDLQRVVAVRAAAVSAGVEPRIRVDVNGAWTLSQAMDFLPQFNDVAEGLEYVEQPCSTLDELRELKQRLDIRIAVDEGIRLATDIQGTVVDGIDIRECADVMIVKSIPLGGVGQALRLIENIGLPVVVSGSLDTSVGLASGLALAGCVEKLDGACGLGTGALLAQDVVSDTQAPHLGVLSVARISPDDQSLGVVTAQVSADEHEHWKQRMVSAWQSSAQYLVEPEVARMVEQW